MSDRHKFLPQHLALAIALALGCAEFSYAQELSTPTEPAVPADLKELAKAESKSDPLSRLQDFLVDPDTTPDKINSPQRVVKGNDGNDLVIIENGGSIKGRADGGGGTNIIYIDASDGGELGDTRNYEGLYSSQGSWTLTSKSDFKEGVAVQKNATLTNKGKILGGAIAFGQLFNSGEIKGHVDVEESGTFAGSGTVGSLEVHGQVSINKLHGAPAVKGDLSLAPTAVLNYGVNADGPGETIKVGGTASLGGATLRIVGVTGDYPESTQHTIIEAKKVEGEFGTVLNDLAFMTPTLDYSEKTRVGLTYARNEVPIESVAITENAQALARNLEEPKATQTPHSANAAVTALLAANKQTASLALEQLAGSSNANLAKATLSSVDPVSSSMLSAMRQLDSTQSTRNLRERSNSPRVAAGSEDNGRVWLQALGHGGKLDRDIEPLQHSTKGLLLGADWSLDEEWRLGVMAGKSRTQLDSRELEGDLDSWHLGAYALRQDGPMSLRLGATYSNHDGSTARRVAFTGFSDRPKGRYEASTQQAFAEVGYNLGRANVSIEPFASLGFQRYQRDGYTEKGGAAALKVHKQAQSNMNSTFGLRLAKVETLDNGMHLTPRFSAGWKHTYGDVYTSTRQQLVTGGSNYSVYGVELDRNSLLVDAGLDLGVSKNHSVGVGLSGEIGSDSRNHGVTGQWRMAF